MEAERLAELLEGWVRKGTVVSASTPGSWEMRADSSIAVAGSYLFSPLHGCISSSLIAAFIGGLFCFELFYS